MPNELGAPSRASRRFSGLLLLAAAVLMMAWPVLAQEEGGGTTIFGTLRAAGEPVEGATVTVSQDGEEVGTATSNDSGEWSVEVPAGGTYTVTIDEGSLAEGLAVRDAEEQASKEITVEEGGRKAVLFPIIEGEGGGAGGSQFLSRASTLFVSGIQLGSVIAITSIGLSLIFGVTGLVNFAHGEMVTFGAVAALYLNAPFGIPNTLVFITAALLALAAAVPLSRALAGGGVATVRSSSSKRWSIFAGAAVLAGVILWAGMWWSEDVNIHIALAGLIAIIGGGFLGYAMEGSIFGPLRRRNVGLIAMLVISIGLSILLRYGILIIYGGNSNAYRQYTIPERVEIGPVTTSVKELGVIVLSVIVLVAVGLLLTRTKLGTAMRAVADNRDLAESSGIDVQRVIMATWIAGGALAAFGGVMQGLMQAVQWDMGFKFLLLMFAGVILGGLGTAFGAVVGGLIVGIVTQMSTLWFSVEMKLVFAFAVLIIVLLVRPQGVLGRKERIG